MKKGNVSGALKLLISNMSNDDKSLKSPEAKASSIECFE